jgi:hypothetical protein
LQRAPEAARFLEDEARNQENGLSDGKRG